MPSHNIFSVVFLSYEAQNAANSVFAIGSLVIEVLSSCLSVLTFFLFESQVNGLRPVGG